MSIVKGTTIKRWSFEYWYMIIMIIYMGQMTPETSRMVNTLSGNPIPFLIPILFTFFLIKRNPIKWDNPNLLKILIIFSVWSFAVIIKFADLSTQFFSYLFFIFYSLIISFIHIKVFKKNIFGLYEDIVVLFSKVSLFLWIVSILLPNLAINFFHLFPETAFGNNFIYIYNWMDPEKGQYYGELARNAGFSWEPGRYAIILCLAIFINLLRNGIRFKLNNNIIYLLLSLITTQSTTGYMITILLYLIFYINKKKSPTTILKIIFIIVPIIIGIMQLDFMLEKIKDRADINSANESFLEIESYYSKNQDLEKHISLDRFQSIYFEWKNFLNDPILGYSTDFTKSLFAKTYISNYSLTGGVIKIFSQFGLFMGLFLYYLLFRSSSIISKQFKSNKSMTFAICIIASSISYPIFGIPIYTTFWLYNFFYK